MTFVKVMVLGEIGVGKTSLVRRLIDGKFQTDYTPTMGVDIYSYKAALPDALGGPAVEMGIWDTDGDFGDSIFRHTYVDGAHGALIVADASERHTQEAMAGLARAFEGNLPGRPFSLVLNKVDLIDGDRQPELPAGLADYKQIATASAKTGANVRQAFHDIAATIIKRGL